MISPAPIALFAYNRLEHLRRTVESLAANHLAADSELYVFSDAACDLSSEAAVRKVRDWLPQIAGFRSVSVTLRPQNLGLAKSIIGGVTEIVETCGRVIVLEDDMVTSPFFLRYMNDALELYAGAEEVISIHGYVYPVPAPLPATFFLRGADCWGWATWRRGWSHFEPDGRKLLAEIEGRGLAREFDFARTSRYMQMLRDQIAGKNDSWAVRWYASAFLAGKLTLYPGKSLVQNIGNDGSGTHCGVSDTYVAQLADTAVQVQPQKIEENKFGRAAFIRYFKSNTGWRGRLKALLRLTV